VLLSDCVAMLVLKIKYILHYIIGDVSLYTNSNRRNVRSLREVAWV